MGLNQSDEEGSTSDEDEEEDETSDAADDRRKPRQYKRLEKEKAAAKADPLSDDDEGMDASDAEASSDEDLARWGSNKHSYYNTNNLDKLESDSEIDEEQAKELELQEVKKLQAKSRRGMDDADFGLGEADEVGGAEQGGKGARERQRRRMEFDGELEAASAAKEGAKAAAESEELPSDAVARAELLVQLQKTSPETIALAGDYADAVEQLVRVQMSLEDKSLIKGVESAGLGMAHLHYQALFAYIAALTFYFHLRAKPKYANNPRLLSQHPVLHRLLKLKEGLSAMEDLGFALAGDDDGKDGDGDDGSEDDSEVEDISDPNMRSFKGAWLMGGDKQDGDDDDLGDLEEDELAGLIADEKENASRKTQPAKERKKARQEAAKASSASAAPNGKTTTPQLQRPPPLGQKAKDRRSKQPEQVAPLADLAGVSEDDPLGLNSYKRKQRPLSSSSMPSETAADGETYGEATSLSSAELEDKAAKRKSLRFYTGQMDAKEARRGQAARDRLGGDADLPYRDRERSRMAVEQAKAARSGASNGNDKLSTALDSEEWGESDTRDWRDVMGAGSTGTNGGGGGKGKGDDDYDDDDDEDDYYDLVTSSRAAAKRAKKEAHDSERDSQRVIEETETEPGAHRAISRQISKNRGLTPHRKQDRNLRVKKRKKFEKAQKKLSSTRAVYKGGQSALQGGYQGESSGINTGVTKSRRFA